MFQFCTSSRNTQLLKLHVLLVLSHHAKWDSSEPPQPWYFWQSNFIQIKNIIKILAMGTEIMQNFLFHNFVTRWRILTWFGSTLKETEPTWTIFGLETSQTLALASSSFRFSPNCQIPSNCVISVSCSFSVSLSLSLSHEHTRTLFLKHTCALSLSRTSLSLKIGILRSDAEIGSIFFFPRIGFCVKKWQKNSISAAASSLRQVRSHTSASESVKSEFQPIRWLTQPDA